jgi:hypothetical protein
MKRLLQNGGSIQRVIPHPHYHTDRFLLLDSPVEVLKLGGILLIITS